jgi:hypothetical protein
MIFSNKNLNQLSQKDLTKLTFSRNLKNIIFFGGGVIIVLFLASLFGTVGIVIGWISIVIYGLFALEPLFAFLLTIPSILLPSSDRRWKFFQLFISGIRTIRLKF